MEKIDRNRWKGFNNLSSFDSSDISGQFFKKLKRRKFGRLEIKIRGKSVNESRIESKSGIMLKHKVLLMTTKRGRREKKIKQWLRNQGFSSFFFISVPLRFLSSDF